MYGNMGIPLQNILVIMEITKNTFLWFQGTGKDSPRSAAPFPELRFLLEAWGSWSVQDSSQYTACWRVYQGEKIYLYSFTKSLATVKLPFWNET